jgi:hypothetical protein
MKRFGLLRVYSSGSQLYRATMRLVPQPATVKPTRFSTDQLGWSSEGQELLLKRNLFEMDLFMIVQRIVDEIDAFLQRNEM